MPQASPKHVSYFYFHFNFNLAKLFLGMVASSLMALPTMAADMSGWSDKTVCRLLAGESDNTEFLAEALTRRLTCGSSNKSIGKKQKIEGEALPKNQGVVLYALNMPPKLKAQLLSQSILKTEFDFSSYQIAELNVPVSCRFILQRVMYSDNPKGQIENWSMASGRLKITSNEVSFNGAWRMGGLSKDPGYLNNEVNLKMTKAGHLVGKMAYFLRNIKPGEVLEKPLYVELKPHKRSQPLDLKSLKMAELWTDVVDWAGGVWTLSGCRPTPS